MIKIVFEEQVEYYYNGCSCCEPTQSPEYNFCYIEGDDGFELFKKMQEFEGSSEQYRCLVYVAYVTSETSLSYHEYIDWCYSLFNYEQMEELLKSDKIEVVFNSEED